MKMHPQDYPFRSVAHRPGFLVGDDAAAEWCVLGFGRLYAFNQEEAAPCFRAATAEDDDLALAWWGLAIAGGPFMNMPWNWFTPAEKAHALPACHAAVRHALRRCEGAAPVVQRLIGVLAVRFPSPDVPSDDQLAAREYAYADAMVMVHDSFGNDPDVAALLVESQIMLTPGRSMTLMRARPIRPAGSPASLTRCGPVPTGTSPHPAFAAGAPVGRGMIRQSRDKHGDCEKSC